MQSFACCASRLPSAHQTLGLGLGALPYFYPSLLTAMERMRTFYYVTLPSPAFLEEWNRTECLSRSLEYGGKEEKSFWVLREARLSGGQVE